MRVERLELKNFRGIREMTLEFPGQVTVLAGVNGAGKSSVLDALAVLLSRLTRRIVSDMWIPSFKVQDIRNGQNEQYCQIAASLGSQIFGWGLHSHIYDRASRNASEIELGGEQVEALVKEISGSLQAPPSYSLPLVLSYGVNRSVFDVPLEIRKQDDYPPSKLTAYVGALAQASVNFADFFLWFRLEEDYENQEKASPANKAEEPSDRFVLNDVRRAIQSFTEFTKLRVERRPLLRMLAEKGQHTLDVHQMSDGEKCLLALVGDLARRLSLLNDDLDNPLEGRGVVLIDEIELHLHPTWQRMVIPKLCEVFPNCQFIVSTHSPQVLGEVDAENIRCLYDEPEKGIQYIIPTRAKGLHSGEILEEIMGAPRQNEGVALRLREIFRLIDREEFEKAKAEINKLREELGGDIPDLVEADSLLFMMSESKAEYNQRGD